MEKKQAVLQKIKKIKKIKKILDDNLAPEQPPVGRANWVEQYPSSVCSETSFEICKSSTEKNDSSGR